MKIEKVEKLVPIFMIKIQNAWLKLSIDNNIDLRKKAKNDI